MKESKFILTTKYDDNKYIITNLITGAVVTIDNNEYKKLMDILKNPKVKGNIDDELYLQACDLGFLVPEDCDELTIAKKMHWRDKVDNSSLNITILPTLKCNFECKYCYEKGVEKNEMSAETFNSIYKLVKSKIKNIESLTICWYGGEPLLVIDKLVNLNEKIMKLCQNNNVSFYSSISTNGYLLNRLVIDKLKNSGINHIETTLAGTALEHDELRFLSGNKPTFNIIINNIMEASKYFKVMVNINVTKTNYNTIDNLLVFLKSNGLRDKIYYTFNRVMPTSNNSLDNIAMEEYKYDEKVIEFFNKVLDEGLNICDVTRFTKNSIFCAAQHINSFTIGPKGNIYKCTEVFDDNNSIGYLSSNGELKMKIQDFYCVNDPFNEAKCKNCDILPYCNGGCSSNGNRTVCPSEKDHLEQYLKIFLRRKEKELIAR